MPRRKRWFKAANISDIFDIFDPHQIRILSLVNAFYERRVFGVGKIDWLLILSFFIGKLSNSMQMKFATCLLFTLFNANRKLPNHSLG
jgi:hypothetical protein